MNADTSAGYRVLAIDDDDAQQHVLKAALHNVARVDFHPEPQPALEAARRTLFDAAIIDVHLRRSRDDGFELARKLHAADPALVVAFYTGDDSSAVLEEALAVRAWKRLLKASSRDEIVATVRACADETRRNRALAIDANLGRAAWQQIAEHVRTVEITRTIADVYRAYFHGLADDLTAAGVTGAAFEALVARLAAPDLTANTRQRLLGDLADTVAANSSTISRLRQSLHRGLSSWDELGVVSERARVGLALEGASRIFRADPRLTPDRVRHLPTDQELILPVSPLGLLNALRNTGLFLLDQCHQAPSLRLMAAPVDRTVARTLLAEPAPLLVLNRTLPECSRFIRLHCACSGSQLELAALEIALAYPPHAGVLYPLVTLTALLGGAVAFQRTQAGAVVEMIFPAWD